MAPRQRGKSGHIQTVEPRRSIGRSQMGQMGRSWTSGRGFGRLPGRRRSRITRSYTPCALRPQQCRTSVDALASMGPDPNHGELTGCRLEAGKGQSRQDRSDEEEAEQELVRLNGELSGGERRRQEQEDDRDQRHGDEIGPPNLSAG